MKIIDYKSKLPSEQKKVETDSTRDYVNKILAATDKSEIDDIKSIKNKNL